LLERSKPRAPTLANAGEDVALQAPQAARDAKRSAPFRAAKGVKMPVSRQRLRILAQSTNQLFHERIHRHPTISSSFIARAARRRSVA
jgi:hypothetical protein